MISVEFFLLGSISTSNYTVTREVRELETSSFFSSLSRPVICASTMYVAVTYLVLFSVSGVILPTNKLESQMTTSVAVAPAYRSSCLNVVQINRE